jgi:multidrug efflux pump subunit AcrA (membrane-fusion protein)
VQYAQQVHQENQQMKARLQQLDQGYRAEYEGRVVSQEQQAKRALTEAHEAGDYERVAEAQSALSQVAIEKERIRLQTAKAQRDAQQREQQAQQQQQQQQYQQQQPQRQAADPKLEKWLSKNDWFEKDNVMKAAATAIHNQIVSDEGFDPSTDEYYAEIDRRIRKEMPHKFQAKQQNAQVVTPASGNGRSLKSGRKRSVELTPGQVAFANKMRIPLDVYAKEVVKLESRSE